MHRVFVYGKLRRGFWRDLILRDSRWLGSAYTRGMYALYKASMPYVTTQKAVSPIVGEVYVIGDAILRDIDRFMGHPHWFRRLQTPVILDSHQGCIAWMYCHPRVGGTLIPSGDLYGNSDEDLTATTEAAAWGAHIYETMRDW